MGLLRRVARARLAGLVIRRLRRAGFGDAKYDARDFRVRFTAPGDETPTILELAPLLVTRGGRRRKRVDRFVAGLVRSPGLPLDWAQARPLLRPVLRGGTPGTLLRRPVLPFLYEFVVVDSPDTMTYVGPEQPASWGVSAEEVFEAARANLTGAVLHGVANEPVVVRFVDDGDAYWTSHLLLQHWLERLAGQVGGTPVAFAPERGTLLVTADGSDHLGGLFAQVEKIYAASSRAITPMAYTSDENGCTVPYVASPGHPLHHAIGRAERILAVQEYTRQAALAAAQPGGDGPAAVDSSKGTGTAAAGSPSRKTARLGTAGAGTTRGRRSTAGGTTGHGTPPGGTAGGATPGDGTPKGTPDDGTGRPGLAELRLVGSDEHGWRTRAIWDRDEPALLPAADEVQVGPDVCTWAELAAHLRMAPGYEPTRWSALGWPR